MQIKEDNLNFSKKGKRSHTIETPHSSPIPLALQEWLIGILRRMAAKAAPETKEEGGTKNGQE